MKLRSSDDVYDFLDKEVSWRILEISSLRTSLATAKGVHYKAIVRAGIPILYAHWEGFVKSASEAYINYIYHQHLNYNDLKTCFVVLGMKNKLSELSESKKSAKNIQSIEFIRNELGNTAILKLENAINTKSNLNSDVFENIAESVGIDYSKYKTKYNLIDVLLLKKRNEIAHGEYLSVKQDEFIELSDEVIGLIRDYKNDISNSIALKTYRI